MNAQSIERNQYFSPRRFFLLLKRDFLTYYRTIIITAAAIGGFVIFASAISALTGNGRNFHPVLYFLLLYIGGFIVSSRGFREIYNSQKSYTYVALPGSRLEKFSERLIATSIGYVLGTLLVYSIVTAGALQVHPHLSQPSQPSFLDWCLSLPGGPGGLSGGFRVFQ